MTEAAECQAELHRERIDSPALRLGVQFAYSSRTHRIPLVQWEEVRIRACALSIDTPSESSLHPPSLSVRHATATCAPTASLTAVPPAPAALGRRGVSGR